MRKGDKPGYLVQPIDTFSCVTGLPDFLFPTGEHTGLSQPNPFWPQRRNELRALEVQLMVGAVIAFLLYVDCSSVKILY